MKNKLITIGIVTIFLISIVLAMTNGINQTNLILGNTTILSTFPLDNILDEKIDIIVNFKEEINKNLLEDNNVEIMDNLESIGVSVVKASAKAIEEIQKNTDVELVELDVDLELFGEGDVISLNEQIIPWGIEKIKAPIVWDKTTGKNIKIAVIDSGVNKNHLDLFENVREGVSFIEDTNYWDDDLGHGTSVAGVISALDNGIGVVGVAPESEIYSIKVIGSLGGKLSDFLQGIQWAIDNDIDIIVMSLGISVDSPSLRKIVDEAYLEGIILVAASGKDNQIYYPAKYSSVIAVGSINEDNELTNENGVGEELEFVAPGQNIISTDIEEYRIFEGASMSAPHVAGVLALLKENNPSLSVNELRAKLQRDAIDLGEKGKDNYFGYGLVSVSLEEENLDAIIQIVFPEEINETKKEEYEINPVKIEIIKIDADKEIIVQTLFYDGNGGTQNISVETGEYRVTQYFDDEIYSNEYIVNEGDIVVVSLHKVNPPVHQWIAYQASFIWSDIPEEITDYIDNYPSSVWDNGEDPYLDANGSGYQPELNAYEGILIGAGEEDEDETDPIDCGGSFYPYTKPFCWHFWNPDMPQDGDYNYGWTDNLYGNQYGSSYTKAQYLWDNKIVSLYNSGNEDEAYYWLGRVAHLLTDASVPAHVHDDTHAVDDDEYEDFFEEPDYTNAWNDGLSNWKHFAGLDYVGQQYNYENIDLPTGVKTNPSNLFKLFYYTAQKTQYYASDDVTGNSIYKKEIGSSSYPFSPSLWQGEFVTIFSDPADLENGWGLGNLPNLKKESEALMPHAMKAVAGLYRLFWASVDADGDNVNNLYDNCWELSNSNQANNDGDSEGDVCDSDDDNDGVNDNSDSCILIYGTFCHGCSEPSCSEGYESFCPTSGAPICKCVPNLVNISYDGWQEISCLINDKLNQSKMIIQYDSNNCGTFENQTFYEYQQIEYCDYCIPQPLIVNENSITTRLELGESFLDGFPETITNNELYNLLDDGVFIDNKSNEFNYNQKIDLEDNTLKMFDDDDYKKDSPTIGLRITSGAHVLNYTLDFTDEPGWADLSSTNIEIMGKEYSILSSNFATKELILLDSLTEDELIFKHAIDVEINGEFVSNMKTYFTTTSLSTPTISKIVIEWKAGDELFVTPDSEVTMPGFETIKLSFAGMLYPSEEVITMKGASATHVILENFPLKDSTENISLVYGDSTTFTGIGKDAIHLLRTSNETSIIFDKDIDDYFVASFNDGTTAESYLMRATDFGQVGITTANRTDIQYKKDGVWTTIKDDAKIADVVTIGNVQLAIGAIKRSAENTVVLTAGTSCSFNTLYSKEGLRVYLPWTDNTNASGVAGAFWDSTNQTIFNIVFSEEDKDGNTGKGKNITAVLGWNSASTPEAYVVDVEGESVTFTEEGENTKNWVSYVYSSLATKLILDKSGDQYELTLVYHGGESLGELTIGSIDNNSGWSEWINQTTCLSGNSYIQNRSKVEYDSNYESCYVVTGLSSDLWNNGENNTFWDFQNISCDFCLPEWVEVQICDDDDSLSMLFNDTSNCYALTNLTSDLENKPNDTISYLSCDYDDDGFIGNISDINTTLENIKITKEINETLIKLNENNESLIEFEFNLTDENINLANLFIEKQSNESTFAYMIIKGLDLTSQNQTKTVYLDKVLGGSGLCIKDEELLSISEISESCTGENETWIVCPNTDRDYICELVNNDTQYKISGLRHSGIKEQGTYCGDGICNGGTW